MIDLAINGGTPLISPEDAIFTWPKYDQEDEKALVEQLRKTVSIYDNSGVFGEFEKAFAEYHNSKYGLLSNSGTSSIFAMYEAINLQPGDEVLCPVYTFHATVSPMIYTGAIPIFCDSDEFGNITADELEPKINNNTKAIIVTHMWGMPVKDIEKIASICKKHNIFLLEDCSHAHGATINNKVVGSFGDLSAWSLQGQKTITGGEGGILTTNSKELFNRALLQGHYNKRPKKEMHKGEANYEFYLTGLGQKLRAHPLAIRLALRQFNKIEGILDGRNKHAQIITEELKSIPFLKVMTPPEGSKSSWYALVIRYDSSKASGVSKHNFVEALHAEGLIEVDIPGSTGLLNELPLFTKPHEIMPRMYNKELKKQTGFKNAQTLLGELVKMPVWHSDDEKIIVQKYIKGIKKVSNYISVQGKI